MASQSTEYWFARRFPIGDIRGGMAPVSWKGWAVALAFVGALVVGAAIWWWFAQRGENTRGVVAFAIVAAAAGLGFIRTANRKGDHAHCVRDYQKGKLSV